MVAEVVAARLAEPALTGPTAVALGRLALTLVAAVAVLIALLAERAKGEEMALRTVRYLPLHRNHMEQAPCTERQ